MGLEVSSVSVAATSIAATSVAAEQSQAAPAVFELKAGMQVNAERKGGYEQAEVVAPSQKKAGQWVVRFESDGKCIAKSPEQMKPLESSSAGAQLEVSSVSVAATSIAATSVAAEQSQAAPAVFEAGM